MSAKPDHYSDWEAVRPVLICIAGFVWATAFDDNPLLILFGIVLATMATSIP